MAQNYVRKMLNIGFRFNPSAEDLITFYLPRLIAGKPPKDTENFIHRADVYGGKPRDLAAEFAPVPRSENGSRFFFTTCKRQKGSSTRRERTAGDGTWVRQNSKEVKNTAGVKVGKTQSFRFMKDGRYTDWLMEEHHCCVQQAVAGDEEPVICRMYVSPRASPDSAARQESAAFVEQEPDPAPRQEHVITPPATAKRPEPPVAEPPCAKKTRGAVSARPVAHQSCAGVAPPPLCAPRCPPSSPTPSSVPRCVAPAAASPGHADSSITTTAVCTATTGAIAANGPGDRCIPHATEQYTTATAAFLSASANRCTASSHYR
ncbi:hypothetical protein E2562_034220 [Oryza meyeriana var. granulata]|uniref:NAC domain-containing protein n=1 Tax=Oryza meyeriana var. granulata TaxID=110450 RepID=A0A6G1CAD8_9ORYZ|nr:hypothetical protein E2562_034220 [Oryza meyeriana var. granulata]